MKLFELLLLLSLLSASFSNPFRGGTESARKPFFLKLIQNEDGTLNELKFLKFAEHLDKNTRDKLLAFFANFNKYEGPKDYEEAEFVESEIKPEVKLLFL